MISDTRKTPFPWFGGKRHAAPHVWAALGDVCHYVEPFAGSLAVLLHRPHPANRPYVSETVNDADGLLINFWRSVQWSPDETAAHASWPVTEADKHARSCAVLDAGARLDLERLMGDPRWHDPELAGWWVWCVCVTIGAFGAGGPWWPDATGRLVKHPRAAEPTGVWRGLPHLGDDGQGVNHAGLRQPGVSRGLPHLGDDGKGVNHAGLRQPGVSRELPHLGDDGQGVNHAGLREAGTGTDPDWHPFVMPDLTTWIRALSARLRHVRIINGDWRRTLGTGAAHTIGVRTGKTPAGVFLDPPYTGSGDVYRDGHNHANVAHDVAEWAIRHGDNSRWRIVAAGYATDPTHEMYLQAGWIELDWYKPGHLRGGYGDDAHQDRLYLSPHCLQPADDDDAQIPLWEMP